MNFGIVLYHQVHELELISLYTPLALAQQLNGDALRVYTLAKGRYAVVTSGGVIITPHWASISAPEPDVLVVPGGADPKVPSRDKVMRSYLELKRGRLSTFAGIGNGAVTLGELGLLRDQEVAAWPGAELLRDYEVGALVEQPVVVSTAGVWSAGAGLAGASLALALLRTLISEMLATEVAERLRLTA